AMHRIRVVFMEMLAPQERTVVANYVTCVDLVMLEGVELEMTHAISELDAAKVFAHMQSEVRREGPKVLERMAADAHVERSCWRGRLAPASCGPRTTYCVPSTGSWRDTRCESRMERAVPRLRSGPRASAHPSPGSDN